MMHATGITAIPPMNRQDVTLAITAVRTVDNGFTGRWLPWWILLVKNIDIRE
jgi:hypothetical protein